MHPENTTPVAATAPADVGHEPACPYPGHCFCGQAPAADWFDTPNPAPRRRKTFEQLLVELADRNGDPVFPVTPADGGRRAQHRVTYTDVIDGLHGLARQAQRADRP